MLFNIYDSTLPSPDVPTSVSAPFIRQKSVVFSNFNVNDELTPSSTIKAVRLNLSLMMRGEIEEDDHLVVEQIHRTSSIYYPI